MADPTRPAPVSVVVMGVSGTGKTTVGVGIAESLGCDFVEGDDLHPPANVAKMASGQPLTDADREPWLRAVAAWIHGCADQGRPGIITCSALRRRYRDVLRAPQVVFVHLVGTQQTIAGQLSQRSGHFMPSSLLDSQLATLEPLESDETGLEVLLGRDPAALAEEVIDRLGLTRSASDPAAG